MRRLIWIFAAVSILSTAAAILLWIDLGAEQRSTDTLRKRLAVVEADHTVASSRRTALHVSASAAPPPRGGMPSSRLPETNPPRSDFSLIEEEIARQRELMQDPRYREAYRAKSRLALAPRRANLIRLLGFTPEEADAVIALDVNQQIESEAAAPSDEATDERRRAEAQAELAKLLDDDKRQRLKYYEDSTQSRIQVNWFRTQLSGADSLRDDQVEPLIDAIHPAEQQLWQELQEARTAPGWNDPSAEGRRRNTEYIAARRKAANERMHDAASAVLSSAQLRQFDGMMQRDLELMQGEQQLEGIQANIEAGTNVAAASRTN